MEQEKRKQIEREIYNRQDDMSTRPMWGEQWDNELMDFLMRERREIAENWANMYLKNKDVLIPGGGRSEAKLVKDRSCKSITVVNISEKEIEKSIPYYPKFTNFIVGDAENMEFKNDSFEVIIYHGILHHLNLTNALSEIKRVLQPQGILFIGSEPGLLNPIAFISRKFFPTNIHTPYEKPFIIWNFRKKLKRKGFKELDFKCFYLLSHAVPIFSKYTSIKNLRWAIKLLLLFERIILKTPIKEFSWYFSAIYQKTSKK